MTPSPTSYAFCPDFKGLLPLLAGLLAGLVTTAGACTSEEPGPAQPTAPGLTRAPLLGAPDDPHLITAPGSVRGQSNAATTSRWYRITVPADHTGLRVAVRSTAQTDVHLRRTAIDTSPIASSHDRTLHTFFRTAADTPADDLWWVQVVADADATIDLLVEPTYARPLTWDNGDTLAGTAAFARPADSFGDHLFSIAARAPRFGAWRNILRVTSGEADLVLANNGYPWDWSGYRSDNAGSDAFVLYHNEFAETQTWYLRVAAKTNDADWSLLSGDIHVADFGPLSDTRSLRTLTMDVGGVAWFRTETNANTLAWRLRAPGAAFHIARTLAPVPRVSGSWNLRYVDEGLVVPDYLSAGGYLVAVTSTAATIQIDSGNQHIIDPATIPAANGSAFDFNISGSDDDGFGYVTYKVEVPLQQIAWQVTATPVTGDIDIYVAKSRVPSELDNEGLSEIPAIADSVTFVPPSLSNGTFYVTVRGRAPFTFNLSSGNPVVTPMDFVDVKSNGAQFEARNGWRYFVVSDIESQVGALGWALDLTNHVPGTEIALRRNAVPGRRIYRDWNLYGSTWTGTVDNVDFASNLGFLERPNHPADIWYVGIHQPNAALGPFTLATSTLTSSDLAFNTGAANVSNQPSGRWRWFKVTVPADALGWDVEIDQVTSGLPKMVVRAELIPGTFGDNPSCCPPVWGQDQWQSGWQWAPYSDLTRRPNRWVGDTLPTIDESGRRLTSGMGTPLRQGVFYIGVSDLWNTTRSDPLSYRIRSRGIGLGANWTFPVEDLAFDNGSVTVTGLAPREIRHYRVTVPADVASFGFELEPTAGEAMMAVRRGQVPSMEAGQWSNSSDTDHTRVGTRRQKNGLELFYRYPDYNLETLPGGHYFIAVGAEGAVTSQDSYIRGGTTSFTLRSRGQLPVNNGGTLVAGTPTTFADQTLRYAEHKAYRFTVPDGIPSVEVQLVRRSGNPWMTLGRNHPFPSPSQPYYTASEGGSSPVAQDDEIVTLANPSGTYTVVVVANRTAAAPHEVGAEFDLIVRPLADATVPFNGGFATIADQNSQTWRYFRITVPEDTTGWDLRLENVQSGRPRMAIRRGDVPQDFGTNPGCCPPISGQDRWENGWSWAPAGELTGRYYGYYDTTTWQGGDDEYGRSVVMGLGAPLSPGEYVIGISDTWTGTSGAPMSYSLVSRGIGIGNDSSGDPWAIQIADLAFAGGSATATREPRRHAWYRVEVPANATSWHLELTPTIGEAMMAVRRNTLPNADAGSWYNSPEQGAGIMRRKTGPEFLYRYPEANQSLIASGTYYIGVGAEGSNAYSTSYIGQGETTFTLTSHGAVTVREAAAPLAAEGLRWDAERVRYGEQRIYRFTVPAGVQSMEVKLQNRSGNPVASIGTETIPAPNQAYSAAIGGSAYRTWTQSIATIAEPQGVFTVVVAGHASPWPLGEVDSTYDLVVEPVGETPLAFNGGEVAVTGQGTGTWKYFRVNVPEGALGWDLRLEDVTAGRPRLVIRRDELPESISTNPGCCPPLSSQGRWLSGWSWAPAGELTQRNYGVINPQTWQGGEDQHGRRVSMGMGTPLEPGTYIIGVSDVSWPAPEAANYRIVSRGIGIGNEPDGTPWAIQIRDLTLGTTVEGDILKPREHVYYRMRIPEGQESWALELETVVGEAMLAVRDGGLPNADAAAGHMSDDTSYYRSGTKRQKNGREFFYKLPYGDGPRGGGHDFYIAVASEGQDPYSTSYIGTGAVAYRLHAHASVPIVGDTSIIVENEPYRFEDQRIAWGQHRYHRLRVPPTVDAFEVRLANRVGTPYFAVVVDSYFDTNYPASNNGSYVAAEGGVSPVVQTDIATQVVGQTGDITIAVHAQGGTAVENEYDLVVTPLRTRNLPWDGGNERVVLNDREVAYFKVTVPADCDETAQVGWIVTQNAIRGSASIEVRKDGLPGGPIGGQVLTTQAKQTIIVPPFLSPGTWYVAVRATGDTEITLNTSEVRADRHWTMPARGQTASTPGLNHPFFADTGIADNGTPIINPASGDQGSDLGQGLYRFYRVTVPRENGGLFRTRLEAISGDPELFIRRGAAPTLTQMPGYWWLNFTDYRDTRDGSSYGHWVPVDTRYGAELAPGDYWIAVYAEGSNVRYRLSLDVGIVNDIAVDGGGITGHALAAGDMRFYRVQIPQSSTVAGQGTPLEWTVNLTQQAGDALVLLREFVPPGLYSEVPTPASADQYLRDWNGDREAWRYGLPSLPNIDATGPRTFSIPIIRPGATYWLGVYARTDTVYDLSSSVSATKLAVDAVIPWTNHRFEATLPAGARRLYRIDVPNGAARWRHTTTVADGVRMDLSANYVPPTTYADWTNSNYGYASNLDRHLDAPGGYLWDWPWAPGISYYLRVENTTANSQPIVIDFDGRLFADDSDNDGLPDGWEYKYFGSLWPTADYDNDSDFLTNAEEYALGTNPQLRDSDGDGLDDGAEILAGADPLLADSDGDGVCDGADSAPTDPNESGPVIRLFMGRWENGIYGHNRGTSEHRTRLVAVFDRSYVDAHWVHITGWGLEEADEVAVWLNGNLLGHLPAGTADGRSVPTIFHIDSNSLLPHGRDNRLELRQKTAGATWGVEDLGLFTYGETFGSDSTRAYDNRHPEGFDIHFPSLADSWLELRAFDLEDANDVEILINERTYLPEFVATGDLAWSEYLQVPFLTGGLGPVRFGVRPRAGSDGDWQLRLMAVRPLLTTFGTEVNRGEGDHLTRQVRFLMPESGETMQLQLRARITDNEQVRYDAAGAASRTFAGVNYWTWSGAENFFNAATETGRVTATRVPADPPPNWFVFVVNVLYYGPCTDRDGNGVRDCEEVCVDGDNDGVHAVGPLCSAGTDCDDNDPEVGASVGDADCDGVPVDLDCDDNDATAGSSVGDADCDGIPAANDCNDNDPTSPSRIGDADCDGVPTADDCDDNDALAGPVSLDRDCDGVLADTDCNDNDATVTTTNVGDADCDGVPDGNDCNPNDPSVTLSNVGDADCDGVPDGVDCNANDPAITTTSSGDADCDGVPDAIDCNPNDPAVTASNVDDLDCDGVPDAIDCSPNDPAVTSSNAGDLDCDGVPDAIDCSPNDPTVTATNVGDLDCDGVPDAVDCDPTDPTIRNRPDANDRDCDGVPTPIDCNDADRNDTRSRVGDADCDGVPTERDCNDEDPSDVRTNTGDFDCDGVPAELDCDDRDASNTRSRAGDADCDGAPTGDDCDDNDPAVQACPVCLDNDEDGAYGRTAECPSGTDCNDGDAQSTTRDVDADCDGVITDADCDDEDPESTVVSDDADCDTVLSSDDCDDNDPMFGAKADDMDCDGLPDDLDNCPEEANPDQADSDLDGRGDVCDDCFGADSDGDYVPDMCDVCPDVRDDQTDSVGDGIGDACRDSDGDGVRDSDDNCVSVANPDQADSDRDGKGDVCDDDPEVVTGEDSEGCGGGNPSGLALWLLLLGFVIRRKRAVVIV